MQRIKFDDYNEGAAIPELKFGPVKQNDLVKYAGASGDFNPIHTDAEFARSVGLTGTIAHGMYVMAQLGRLATNWAHPAQISNLNVKFKGMVLPGDEVVCKGVIKKKKEEDGKKILTVAIEALGPDQKARVSGEFIVNCD